MRTVMIEKHIGSFEELSPELQKRALNKFREFFSQDYDFRRRS